LTVSGTITSTNLYASSTITAYAGIYINSGGMQITGGLTLNEGGLAIRNNNTLTCAAINASGTVTATSFNSTSDYRIKQFVQPIIDNSVDQLNPVSYYNILSNKTDLGFIAHEVQPHFPMLVNGEKDGQDYQSINYIGLIPVLVAEIKDLKLKVQMLINERTQSKHNLE
jgi:hypothetical protein